MYHYRTLYFKQKLLNFNLTYYLSTSYEKERSWHLICT